MGSEVSKIGQAEWRSGESKKERKVGRVETGLCGSAFNIFLVNLTAPFRFIAGLGVQVLSARVRGRLIFNFISPSLHFIDGVACRRRHLSLTRACAVDLCARSDCYGTESFSVFAVDILKHRREVARKQREVVSAVDRLLDRSRSLSKRFSIFHKKNFCHCYL